MTETLLERIVATGSEIVMLDITGVPVVDTAVARHLWKPSRPRASWADVPVGSPREPR